MKSGYGKNSQIEIYKGKGEELIIPISAPEDVEISIEAEMLMGLRYGELEIQEIHKPRIEIRKGQLFREVAEP